MSGAVSHINSRAVQVIIGVDTHKDQHVAVALDGRGVRLDEKRVPVATCGYEELERWSCDLGRVHTFGIEGTGSYGAGLARFLTDRSYRVVEVNRPDRSVRYRKGKSGPHRRRDGSARSACRCRRRDSQVWRRRSRDDSVCLRVRRNSAVKARTQAVNQMKALVLTAPAGLRETLDGLSTSALVKRCKSFRPGRPDNPTAAAKYALRSLACRYRQLSKEVQDLKAELERLIQATAPALVEAFGVGPDTAAALLIAAGSNPDRLNSEAAFASLCGVSPVPASSGKTNRHRLNRGGDRQANAALYRIVVVRLRYDLRTQAYLRRRTAEGMSKVEVIRCLKRYVAREVYSIIRKPAQTLEKAA